MFLLFEGYDYYPAGGWNDLSGKYETLEEAKAAIDKKLTWYHIVDVNKSIIVESN